ncbi:rod shape-determining protein RodA [Grimontia hollisae]|uniref:rod shape-determining protein RodA n=1 Tax=Grimontia hollisae TaxID=673 RepID=UPI0013034550|nr:rod shape-determining protein RodA [Grimontia hollisae]
MNVFRPRLDYPLLMAIIALITFGSMSVWSASGYSVPILERHLARAGFALFALFFFSLIPAKKYKTYAPHLFGITIILLLGVLLAGETVNGAKRWLVLGPVRFQPSELVKVAVPMIVAWLVVRDPGRPGVAKIALCVLVTALPASMIVIQPDLDGAIFTVMYALFVLFLAGMSWRIIGTVLAAVGAVLPVMWFFFMADYQKQRVNQFLNPESDPLGAGYQIIQSLIAIGSGGVSGKGFMHATQGQLGFIPESHTDFIFSTFAEEWGFLGSVVMILLYLFISGRILWLAVNTASPFSRLVSGALAMSFFLYAFINLGMVSGLLPVMGSPLPFISYGGTAMITQGACFGIIMALCCGKQPMVATWSARTFTQSPS